MVDNVYQVDQQMMLSQENKKTMPESNRKQDIKYLFEDIQQIVVELIQYLNNLYSSYNLTHSADKFYETLIRLFSPFEVLINQRVDIAQVYDFDHKNKNKCKQFPQTKQRSSEQEQESLFNKDKNEQRVIVNSHAFVTKLVPDIQKNSTYFGKRKQNISKKGKKIGRPPALDDDLELELCKWVKGEHEGGRQVTKMNIVKRAQQMSTQKNFNASLGWVDKFLRRNPLIKLMVASSKHTVNQSNLKITTNFYLQNEQSSNQSALEYSRQKSKSFQFNNYNYPSKVDQNQYGPSSNNLISYPQQEEDQQSEINQEEQQNFSLQGHLNSKSYHYSEPQDQIEERKQEQTPNKDRNSFFFYHR